MRRPGSASVPERPKPQTLTERGETLAAFSSQLVALRRNACLLITFPPFAYPCIKHNTGYFNCPQGTPQMQFPETSSRRGIWPKEVRFLKKMAQEETERAQRSVDSGSDHKNVACCGCPTTDFTMSWCSCHNTFTMWKIRERKGCRSP